MCGINRIKINPERVLVCIATISYCLLPYNDMQHSVHRSHIGDIPHSHCLPASSKQFGMNQAGSAAQSITCSDNASRHFSLKDLPVHCLPQYPF